MGWRRSQFSLASDVKVAARATSNARCESSGWGGRFWVGPALRGEEGRGRFVENAGRWARKPYGMQCKTINGSS